MAYKQHKSNSYGNGDRHGDRPHFLARGQLPNQVDIIRLPPELLEEDTTSYSSLVVITFEGPVHPHLVKNWISAFNQDSTIQLSFHEELINSLFVVSVTCDSIADAKKALLEGPSPLQALGSYAAVNDYYAAFDPQHPADFKQLVTILINKGNPTIKKYLDYIIQPFGSVVYSSIAPGFENHRISALIQTTHKVFPEHKFLQLRANQLVFVKLEYLSDHLRCSFCFTYAHPSAVCHTLRHVQEYNFTAAQSSTSRPLIEASGRTAHGVVPHHVFQPNLEPLLPLPPKKVRLDHDVLHLLNTQRRTAKEKAPATQQELPAKAPSAVPLTVKGNGNVVAASSAALVEKDNTLLEKKAPTPSTNLTFSAVKPNSAANSTGGRTKVSSAATSKSNSRSGKSVSKSESKPVQTQWVPVIKLPLVAPSIVETLSDTQTTVTSCAASGFSSELNDNSTVDIAHTEISTQVSRIPSSQPQPTQNSSQSLLNKNVTTRKRAAENLSSPSSTPSAPKKTCYPVCTPPPPKTSDFYCPIQSAVKELLESGLKIPSNSLGPDFPPPVNLFAAEPPPCQNDAILSSNLQPPGAELEMQENKS